MNSFADSSVRERLSKGALARINAKYASFCVEFNPRFEREANRGLLSDASLIAELAAFNLRIVTVEFFPLCEETAAFDYALDRDIPTFVRSKVLELGYLKAPMLEELSKGFDIYLERTISPWIAAEREVPRRWIPGVETAKRLTQEAQVLRAEYLEAKAGETSSPAGDLKMSSRGDKLRASVWRLIDKEVIGREEFADRSRINIKTLRKFLEGKRVTPSTLTLIETGLATIESSDQT